MQPYKLLACLVTLQFTCSLTLKAADQQDFRQWTDTNGRTMTARLVDVPTGDSVKIERQDGRLFTVALKTFSTADQDYVKTYNTEKTAAVPLPPAADDSPFKKPDASTWSLLNAAGSQSASMYHHTPLEVIIDGLNKVLAEKTVKTSDGLFFMVRTEPSGLASRIQLTGDMPAMPMADFVKEVARANDLVLKTDKAGMLVLLEKTRPNDKPALTFLGVPVNDL